MRLDTLGWDERRDAEFEPHRAEGLEPGRVSLEHNHVYRVFTARGEGLAEAAGRIKHLATGRRELPAVGDWVAVKRNPAGSRDVIQAILPRRTFFSRRAVGRETEEQVIAANVDTVLIVFGLDTHVKPRALERYVTMARRAGAQPVIVLNKSDLAEDLAANLAEATVVAGDVQVHAVSALEEGSLAVLTPYLTPGKTLALLGPSGVGKSSLVNRLMGGEVLAIAAVREWDARGRHTSVHRQMLVSPSGGLIIDTPGMRELQLWDPDDSLDDTFADVLEFAPGCRFRDCRHDSEPGCAVKAAIEASGLPADRYESYLKLRGERESLEKQRDQRAHLDARRKARAGSKALKAMQKERGR
jgi:ribosome biogenesis GTPase